ncbi:MAG: cell division protein ZapD [Gammaproteobacteria bacterium]|nr:cell division protein ZapD [Gammaproteobacteria bacterium]
MPETTVFEHPLNEKCRTWLRLSHLYEQFDFHRAHDTEWHARGAMAALLDIANVLARADIKSELLKELDRYLHSLSRMADSPGVDNERLRQILDHLAYCTQGVRDVSGQLGQALRSNDFLNSIVQRSSIAGGSFDFDLPQYHHWLQMPQAARSAQLDDWHGEIGMVQDAVDLLLNLIRGSAIAEPEVADAGFFQRSLAGNTAAQLVRVSIPSTEGIYAEISGGKHRFTVRFLDSADWQHPIQVEHDVQFRLTVCLI